MNYQFFNPLRIFAILTLILLIIFVYIARGEYKSEWGKYQRDYKNFEIIRAATKSEREEALKIPIKIRQTVLDDLKRVDRCTTCHVTVDEPAFAGGKQPLSYHPDHKIHPFEKFGCTICHRGYGRAITKREAHGEEGSPMLSLDYIQSACGKCHNPSDLVDAPLLNKGVKLFEEKGCIGCHRINRVGGAIGPDLSRVGKNGYKTTEWLFRHFKSPQDVVPGSSMPKLGFTDEEAKALTLYMLSLDDSRLTEYYLSRKIIPDVSTGRRLFSHYSCYNCHRIFGEGGDTGPDLTTLASKRDAKWIRGHITEPSLYSPKTIMPKYNLSENETNALTQFILSLSNKDIVGFYKPEISLTDEGRGEKIFVKYGCTGCHGEKGKGGIYNKNAKTNESVPPLTNVVEGYTDNELKKKIQKGVAVIEKRDPNGETPPLYMPAWGNKISEVELDYLVKFLFSLAPKMEKSEDW